MSDWKIPVTLSEMKLRADSIGGEIKQADANIIEAKVATERAKSALALAETAERKAIEAAADKRKERDALASGLYAYTKGLGEVLPAEPPPIIPARAVGIEVVKQAQF